jgi:hypothetical protein
LGRPDAHLLALPLHCGIGNHRPCGQRRQVDRDLGALADRRQGQRHGAEGDLGQQFLGHGIGAQFGAQHLAVQVWPRRERRATRAGCAAAKPPALTWSKRVLTHSDFGSTSSTTAWPATTVVPGSTSREVTTPCRRRHQTQAAALRAQRLQVGQGSGLVLAHGGQCGEGELQILAARGEQFLARSLLGEQLFIAARLCLGVGMARRRIGQGGSGALARRIPASAAGRRCQPGPSRRAPGRP